MAPKMMKMTTPKNGIRYGLAAEPDEHGYRALYVMVRGLGVRRVGQLVNPENFETAIDAAEESVRALMEKGREEIGMVQTSTGFRLG